MKTRITGLYDDLVEIKTPQAYEEAEDTQGHYSERAWFDDRIQEIIS